MDNKLNLERRLLPAQMPVSPYATQTPAGHPFSIPPWNYLGSEGLDFIETSYAATVVDWILVSFRTSISKSSEIAKTAALLHQNGTVEWVATCPLRAFEGQALYVVVEHRFHVGIMTSEPVIVENSTLTFDFTETDTYRDLTSFGQKELITNVWGMFTGDADQLSDIMSYDINGTDNIRFSGSNGLFDVYDSADFNLDGDISLRDKILWFNNLGVTSRVPK